MSSHRISTKWFDNNIHCRTLPSSSSKWTKWQKSASRAWLIFSKAEYALRKIGIYAMSTLSIGKVLSLRITMGTYTLRKMRSTGGVLWVVLSTARHWEAAQNLLKTVGVVLLVKSVRIFQYSSFYTQLRKLAHWAKKQLFIQKLPIIWC